MFLYVNISHNFPPSSFYLKVNNSLLCVSFPLPPPPPIFMSDRHQKNWNLISSGIGERKIPKELKAKGFFCSTNLGGILPHQMGYFVNNSYIEFEKFSPPPPQSSKFWLLIFWNYIITISVTAQITYIFYLQIQWLPLNWIRDIKISRLL